MAGGSIAGTTEGAAGHGAALWEALQQPGMVPAAAVQALVHELSAGQADLARFREEPLRAVSREEWMDILGTYQSKLGDRAVDAVLAAHLTVLQRRQSSTEERGYISADDVRLGCVVSRGVGRA